VTDQPERRSDAADRRSGKPGPIPGGVERRRAEGDRRSAARPARRDDLAGTVRTGLSPSAALRARDLDRPTADDLARAEAELTIVRRHWTPPPT
jgi:hypothetical protein